MTSPTITTRDLNARARIHESKCVPWSWAFRIGRKAHSVRGIWRSRDKGSTHHHLRHRYSHREGRIPGESRSHHRP